MSKSVFGLAIAIGLALCSTALPEQLTIVPQSPSVLLGQSNTWSSAQTFSSAPVLSTLTGPLIGNGASAVTAGTKSGNTTVFGTTNGTLISGDCVKIDASGNLVDAGAACGGGAITPYSINNICYVDGVHYANLAAALTSCSSNSTIIVPSSQTISTAITVAGAGVEVRCANNASLNIGQNDGLTFTGDHSGVSNCNVVGPGGTLTTAPIINLQGTNQFFTNNIVTSVYDTGGGASIGAAGSNISGLIVQHNRFNTRAPAFEAYPVGVARNIIISNNYAANGLIVYPLTGATMTNVTVSNNVVTMNDNGNTAIGGCVVALAGAAPISEINIVNNTCQFKANGTLAGANAYALGELYKATIANNTIDPGAYHLLSGNYLLEYNGGSDATITGNVIVGGGTEYGIVLERVSPSIIADNEVKLTGAGFPAIYINPVGTTSTGSISDISVTGNVIYMTGASSSGIKLLCALNVLCYQLIISGNLIDSDAAVSQIGIRIDPNGGTLNHLTYGPNTITAHLATGVSVATGVTAQCFVAGGNFASIPISNSGSASACN